MSNINLPTAAIHLESLNKLTRGAGRMIARKSFWAVALIVAVAAMSLAQSPIKSVQSEDTDLQALTGTWTTTVTPPRASGVPPFKLNFTFTNDGNLIATGNGGGELPALGNPCQGVWAKTGRQKFGVTYLCLDFDSNLQFTGSDKIRGFVQLDRTSNRLRGSLDLTHFDTNDNQVFSACCAMVKGTRLQLEQLPE